MSITSLNDYIAAAKQRVVFTKTLASRSNGAITWASGFDFVGQPGAGVLAGTSTAVGVVPDATVVGYPAIAAFTGGATGYLSKVEFGNTTSCRFSLFDRLFLAGAYSFNAAVTLGSQPSYAARVPGSDYTGLELWLEQVTAATGAQSVAVTYTNQAGTPGKTTGTVTTPTNFPIGRCVRLPLAAGDSGIQKVESVTGTVASAGTFNIMVLRPLWSGRVKISNDGDVHNMLKTGLPQVYATSALYVLLNPDTTAYGIPEAVFEIANK